MSLSPVLPVVVSLLSATVLAALGKHLKRILADALAIGAALAVSVLALLLAIESAQKGRIITWFSGWTPVGQNAIGISFVIDPYGGALAAFGGLLVTAALLYSVLYFESAGRLFHVLMLLFLAGLEGFCLTGDLFNLFVFFEVLSVSAYALTGYKIEERGPIQGALNFAVSNTVGSYLLLLGIAVLYADTRALNMAQLGMALEGRPLHAVVILGFVMVVMGLGVKAALWPLHFWLPDAHAVAPTPVSVLFSSIMVELGVYGIARLYWTVFSGVPALHGETFSKLLMALGMVTAVWGGVMALMEPHLKRLLAFSTMSHVGVMVLGLATLRPDGIAGAALYLLGHGCAKAALFFCAGALLSRFSSVDVDALHGKGRAVPWLGIVFGLGGLALCDMPPFGTFLGRSLIESAGHAAGFHLPKWIALVASGLSGAAILNAGARIFLGWGGKDERESGAVSSQKKEAPERSFSPWMTVLAAVLVLGSLAVGVVPHGVGATVRGAETFTDHAGYLADVIGQRLVPTVRGPIPSVHGKEILLGFLTVVFALISTAFALWRTRLPDAARTPFRRAFEPFGIVLRKLQSGMLADYVTWIAVGAAAYGGFVAWMLR